MIHNSNDRDLVIVRSLGCQWIGSDQDPRAAQITYCGNKDLVDSTCYCTEHNPLMRRAGTALRKRAKDKRKAIQQWDLESLFNEAVEELVNEGVL